MRINHTLKLGFLVCCKRDNIEVVFIYDLNRVHDLRGYFKINELRLLKVIVMFFMHSLLDFQEVEQGYLLEDFGD